jgi:hypothetical protein
MMIKGLPNSELKAGRRCQFHDAASLIDLSAASFIRSTMSDFNRLIHLQRRRFRFQELSDRRSPSTSLEPKAAG